MTPRQHYYLCWRHVRGIVSTHYDHAFRTVPPGLTSADKDTLRMMNAARWCWWERREHDDTAKARTRLAYKDKPLLVYSGKRQRPLPSTGRLP